MERNAFQHQVQDNPYLVINGRAVCLSKKEKASEDIDVLCRDIFFSEALIDEPVRCSSGHTFEKRFIEEWVGKQGDTWGMCIIRVKSSHFRFFTQKSPLCKT